ncbi:putative LRR receptor-like serine/threonine-protein kinase [Heracleum sosnowskyi]|uniref:LRR receptor-like serine/threonine-protein kinase n=1 Tax=Heracleum sosnowskyi TaxID=360622 RepID=A0AAD8HV83_9APIA|nr:putative LRR receptor-like serine/threonine-protein kinase [Heracleum sosnowskyi]
MIWLLQNNNITGGILPGLGNLRNFQTLDLSNNKLFGSIPESLGLLNNLQYLRLNNNTLSGAIPLTRLTKLTFLDLSFNNLSGPVAKFPATIFKYASPAENNSIFC